jgi:hypothetical protein
VSYELRRIQFGIADLDLDDDYQLAGRIDDGVDAAAAVSFVVDLLRQLAARGDANQEPLLGVKVAPVRCSAYSNAAPFVCVSQTSCRNEAVSSGAQCSSRFESAFVVLSSTWRS